MTARRAAAANVVGPRETPPFVDVLLAIGIAFRIACPAGHRGEGKTPAGSGRPHRGFPRGKPDIDKLARSSSARSSICRTVSPSIAGSGIRNVPASRRL